MRIALIIFATFLFSCNLEKKLNKIYLNKPELVAKKTSIWFPCVDTKIDNTIKIINSLIYIECPGVSNNTKVDLGGVSSVSKYLGVTNKTIYNYIDNGIFKEYVHFKRVLNKNSVRIRFIENAIINFKKGL